MVEAVRAGASMRSVARRFDVALPTVQRWVIRAKDIALDEWSGSLALAPPTRPVVRRVSKRIGCWGYVTNCANTENQQRGQVYYHSTNPPLPCHAVARTRFIGWRRIRPTVVK
jgi:transposase-like protein